MDEEVMGGYLSHGNGKYGVVTGIFVRGVMLPEGRILYYPGVEPQYR